MLAAAAEPVELALLSEHPDAADTVARWLHRRWMRHYGYTLRAARAEVRSRLNRDRLPMAWVARAGGEVVGTVSISADARAQGTDSGWCLAGLYVAAPWRRRGVGRRLCSAATAYARQSGVQRLGLYTLDQAAYFARDGWQADGVVEIALGGAPQPVTRMAMRLDNRERSRR